ncbi:hypothetical protein [Paraburkholderia humisilvae]|uniref:Uncharacterized protein n=1 Tax=Paraburkholderia humisilvae TaxID=627669 RepID=A0A6J5F708_9BURK|nr:hypothetical protein [Paraburkholderia humisilvae]CAB3774688.1 hypothetical protein LMG29542_08066 [Paraburkholderia humisilvae]
MSSIFNTIKQNFDNQVSNVKGDASQLAAAVKKQGSDLQSSIQSFHNGNFTADLRNGLSTQLSDSTKTIGNAGKTWYTAMNAPSNSVLNTVKQDDPSTARYINGYQTLTDNVQQGVTKTFSNIPKGVQDIGTGSSNVVSGLEKGNAHQVFEGGRQVVNGVGDIPTGPESFFGSVVGNTVGRYTNNSVAQSAAAKGATKAAGLFRA